MGNKFYIVLALMLLQSLCAGAQVYFCNTPSAVCRYVRKEIKTGKTRWVHTLTIDSVTSLPDGARDVKYHSSFKDDKGKSMFDKDIHLGASIAPSGDVSITLADAMASVMRTLMPNARIRSEGDRTVLPSDMQPGDTLPNAASSATVGAIRYTARVSDRKVVRKERLTTPAGTFDCIVVLEHKEEKAGPYNRVTNAYTWYSPGVGMVRHDTYDRNMKQETSEVLVEIKR